MTKEKAMIWLEIWLNSKLFYTVFFNKSETQNKPLFYKYTSNQTKDQKSCLKTNKQTNNK